MTRKLIPLSEPAEWKSALEGIPHAFGHTWENCQAMHLTTGYPTFLFVAQKGNQKIICPITERVYRGYTDILTPYGFSGFAGDLHTLDLEKVWSSFVKERGYICGFIGLNPLFSNPIEMNPKEIHCYNTLFLLDLKPSIQDIYQGFSENRKRQIKKFDKLEITITQDKKLTLPFFLDHLHPFMKEKKAGKVNFWSAKTMDLLMGVENVFTFGIMEADKIIAASLFAITPFCGEYLTNVSLSKGKDMGVPLIWEAIKKLKSQNIPYLNLGGGIREGDALADFKRRFGATKHPLCSLKQVYNEGIYRSLCLEKGLDPDKKNGFFPPYWLNA
ncbi:hypothetical protein [Pararhodonellum marinum]|uniref:hypothetical protein n=1 Tax=Pararhodonellum marinum TaxID=2755358 RepID=UPI00188F5298|nr:hypothetical protein [Pararhodonellum marinum]